MFYSLLTHPNSLFGQVDRLQRELDDIFGGSGLPSSCLLYTSPSPRDS